MTVVSLPDSHCQNVPVQESAPAASRVAMEINSRCAVLRALKKKRVTYDVARRFQQQLLNAAGLAARPVSVRNAAETQPIPHFDTAAVASSSPKKGEDETAICGDPGLLDLRTTRSQSAVIPAASGMSPPISAASAAAMALPVSNSLQKAGTRSASAHSYGEGGARGWGTGRAVSTAARAAKVAAMTGQSEEQRIAVAVQGWLMSPDAKEGRARARFVEAKFPMLLQRTLQALSRGDTNGAKSAAKLSAQVPRYRPGRITDRSSAQKKLRHKGATLQELQSSQLLAMDSLYGGEVRFIGGAGGVGNAPSTLHSVERGVVLGTSISRVARESPTSRAGAGIRVLSHDERMLSRSASSETASSVPPPQLAGATAEGGGQVLKAATPPLLKKDSGPRRRRRSASLPEMPPPGLAKRGGIMTRIKGLFGRKTSGNEEQKAEHKSDEPTEVAVSTVVSAPRPAPSGGVINPIEGGESPPSLKSGTQQASFRDLITGLGALSPVDVEDSEEEETSSSDGEGGNASPEHAQQARTLLPKIQEGSAESSMLDSGLTSQADLDEVLEGIGGDVEGGSSDDEGGGARASLTSSSGTSGSQSSGQNGQFASKSASGALQGGVGGSLADESTPRVRRRSMAAGSQSPATAPPRHTSNSRDARSVSMAAFDWIKHKTQGGGSGKAQQGSWNSLASAPETPDKGGGRGAAGLLKGGGKADDDAFVDGLVASATPSAATGQNSPSTSGMAAWSRARTRVLAVVRLAGEASADASPGTDGAVCVGGRAASPEGGGAESLGSPPLGSPPLSVGPTAAEAQRAEWRRTVFMSPAVLPAGRRSLHGSGGGMRDAILRSVSAKSSSEAASPGARQHSQSVTGVRRVSRNLEDDMASTSADQGTPDGTNMREYSAPPSPVSKHRRSATGDTQLLQAPVGPGIRRSQSLNERRSPYKGSGLEASVLQTEGVFTFEGASQAVGGGEVGTVEASCANEEGETRSPEHAGDGDLEEDACGLLEGGPSDDEEDDGCEGGIDALEPPPSIDTHTMAHLTSTAQLGDEHSAQQHPSEGSNAEEAPPLLTPTSVHPSHVVAVSSGSAVAPEVRDEPPPPLGSGAPRLPPDNACESLRCFMDGLHDHILQNRESQLKALQIQLPYYKDNEGGIVVNQGGGFGRTEPSERPTGAEAVVSSLDTVSAIAMRAVEVACYSPLKDALLACLECTVDPREESGLLAAMMALRRAPQAAFNIPQHLRVPDQWAAAVLELQEAEVCELPSDKLRALLAAARAIYAEYAATERQKALLAHIKTHPLHAALIGQALGQHSAERGGGASGGRGTASRSGSASSKNRSGSNPLRLEDPNLPPPAPLGADDFFPVFTFVVVRAQLTRPLLLKELLWSLCDPLMLQGEGGYYLTVYEAALEYIRNMDTVAAVSMDMETCGVVPAASAAHNAMN